MRYSVIVPVYNRPDEVEELLRSVMRQTFTDFEVIIVEDGSTVPCKDVVDKYAASMDIRYYLKSNSGPGMSRNYGAERSCGEYLIILDSDCIVPPDYFKAVEDELRREASDAFGGPDCAHQSFSDTQKAINYSMTSFFTTGGIRGGKKKLDKFYPRSFNMGIRADVYKALGGFSDMRFAEDLDFSIRIFKGGYTCRLFPKAWVWHKRRTDMRKFFKQVYNSGIARINLYKKYPESLKMVHLLPAVFTVGVVLTLLAILAGMYFLSSVSYSPDLDSHDLSHSLGKWLIVAGIFPLLFFSLLIFTDSSARNRSLKIGAISVLSSFVQLTGYGSGFLIAWWRRCVRGGKSFSAFEKTLYK